ncbi:MAG: UDP-N-acetylmuramate dehydrogenase [Tannerellaceae bacterium]|nr:UDP-N-acetylmuramate dehydrogenase [Tannerellaceae bacterium]
MKIEQNYSLINYNTFRLQVNSRWFMEYDNEEELQKILRDEYFQESLSLHIGSGSNLLFLNDYNGIILHSNIKGIEITHESGEHVFLRIGAAEKWDDIVAFAVEQGWGGIENLSGIPGEAGAAAVQNIGAYGMEIRDVIEAVETYNQLTFERKVFTSEECNYGYRNSYFKNEHNDPYIVTYINIKLCKNPQYCVDYGNLRQQLGKEEEMDLKKIREAVLAIRKEKLPDPGVIGNAGSFFTNPAIEEAHFNRLINRYPRIPSYPVEEGKRKIPAGWLIEQCGFKGKTHGNVGVHEKQALILVNLGEATGDEIALVAESIRMAVLEQFEIELIPEVKYIG